MLKVGSSRVAPEAKSWVSHKLDACFDAKALTQITWPGHDRIGLEGRNRTPAGALHVPSPRLALRRLVLRGVWRTSPLRPWDSLTPTQRHRAPAGTVRRYCMSRAFCV